jgi:hypothetical protein
MELSIRRTLSAASGRMCAAAYERLRPTAGWRPPIGSPHHASRGLRSFDDDRRQHGAIHQAELGTADIELETIVGSVGRVGDFDRRFRPRHRHLRERLERLGDAYPENDFPVIDVYGLSGRYYVVDGHHRVALARRRGMIYITAKVVQVSAPGHDGLGGMPRGSLMPGP